MHHTISDKLHPNQRGSTGWAVAGQSIPGDAYCCDSWQWAQLQCFIEQRQEAHFWHITWLKYLPKWWRTKPKEFFTLLANAACSAAWDDLFGGYKSLRRKFARTAADSMPSDEHTKAIRRVSPTKLFKPAAWLLAALYLEKFFCTAGTLCQLWYKESWKICYDGIMAYDCQPTNKQT
jgi:hypothetical protein